MSQNLKDFANAGTGAPPAYVFVENAGGTALLYNPTFDGYTIAQIAQALFNQGILG